MAVAMTKKVWEVEDLVDFMSTYEYGTVFEHNAISNMLDVPKNSTKYRTSIAKLKKLMLEKGKMLESLRGVGYKIVNPSDYAGKAINQYKLGFNRLTKGEKILNYTPVNDLSDEDRKVYNAVTDGAVRLNASLAGGIVELNRLNKSKSHPFLDAVNNSKF